MPTLSRSTSVKAATLAAACLILLIPLGLLADLVTDRVSQRDKAVESVARGWGDRQSIGGPIIAIPVTKLDAPDQPHDWYVLPETLNLSVDLQVDAASRTVGPYAVPVYVAHVHATGEFDVAKEIARLALTAPTLKVHADQARLLLPIKDPRGVRTLTSALQAFQGFAPASGFAIPTLAAPLEASGNLTAVHHFDLTFDVAGTQSLQFLPLGRNVRVSSHGNWATPGFTAGFLPTQRRVGAADFTADWQILDLNRTFGDGWFQNAVTGDALLDSGFGIELVQPVDIYQRTMRSVKYGGLFIALSFMTLFLVESLQRKRIHPIQYGLMGLAMSVFYLLLLAFSEILGFAWAYVIAATALCSLIGCYLTGALRSTRAGAAATGIFAGTYALLYLLVTSENYALLTGSIALFALLATVMLLTRQLDWYQDP